MGIRVAIVDDNPHLAWEGRTYPVNATFQAFASVVLDLPGEPVVSIVSCVPLRAADIAPVTLPIDPRIEVVGTAPFDGIAGYLRHLPAMLRTNRPVLGRALAGADLLWLKVPASNAGLAAALAVRAGMPRFVWVAGSAAEVARGRYGGLRAMAGVAVGAGYDLVGGAAAAGGRRLVVGAGIVDGDGVAASLVEPGEVRDPGWRPWLPRQNGELHLAWAGRLTEGKGLEALIGATAADERLQLDILGDGPARDPLSRLAERVGAADRIRWAGHVADRVDYLDRLATADAFVFPSPAEGFPKVVLDAFAVGLPVLATRAGALAELADAGLVGTIERPDAAAIGAALARLRSADPAGVESRRRRASEFASSHTRPAEAARLVARWQAWWPDLPWGR